jgi:hypothetical protein
MRTQEGHTVSDFAQVVFDLVRALVLLHITYCLYQVIDARDLDVGHYFPTWVCNRLSSAVMIRTTAPVVIDYFYLNLIKILPVYLISHTIYTVK